MQSALNDCRALIVRHYARSATVFIPFSGIYNALSGSGQPFDTARNEPASPFANGIFMNAHLTRNFLVFKPLGTQQDHPATVRQ